MKEKNLDFAYKIYNAAKKSANPEELLFLIESKASDDIKSCKEAFLRLDKGIEIDLKRQIEELKESNLKLTAVLESDIISQLFKNVQISVNNNIV